MAITFPSNPSPGATHTAAGITWEWDGTSWVSLAPTGGGGAHENRPPFYALCYIMKT